MLPPCDRFVLAACLRQPALTTYPRLWDDASVFIPTLRTAAISRWTQSEHISIRTAIHLGKGLNHVIFHVWPQVPSGGVTGFDPSQYVADDGVSRATEAEVGSGGSREPRYHMRLRQITDTSSGVTSVGTPHHEIYIDGCGHAVDPTVNGISGFDMAKQRLYNLMSPSHTVNRYEQWGNTRSIVQRCTSRGAQSNGWVRAFSIPSWWH